MICDLTAVTPQVAVPGEVDVRPLADADVDDLYAVYVRAFAAGDADFFFTQSEAERREYFDTLGREAALGDVASHVLYADGNPIGFTYVLPYGTGNRHVSCMAVLPDHQGKGLGRLMLAIAQERAAADGARTMTLGTETGMRAHDLYSRNGFVAATG